MNIDMYWTNRDQYCFVSFVAHKANVHGQTSKQARTIEFQFNLAPRGRANQNQENASASNINETVSTPTITTTVNPIKKVIDAKNEQEFPSLGNIPINIRPTLALNMRSSASGLARTKENFPALAGSSPFNREPVRPPNLAPSASKLLFKMPAKASTTNNASSKNSASNKAKAAPIKPHDFPALPGSFSSSRSYLDSDMIETPFTFHPSAVSSKHRGIVPTFEGITAANAVANQKIKTIPQVETKAQTVSQDYMPSIKSNNNFPALGGSSSSAAAPQWLNGTTASKKQPQISKKLKVAPAPILPTSKSNENNSKEEKSKEKKKEANKTESSIGKKSEKEKPKNDSMKKMKENNDKNINGNKNEKKTNESYSKPEQNGGSASNGTTNSYSAVAHFTMPPPGFPAKKNEKTTNIPPGFEKLSKDSKAKAYMSPSNALQRNQVSNSMN